MKRIFWSNTFSAIAVVGLLGFGCSQDRNADDFKKQHAQDQRAKLTPAVGRYSGVLTDASGNPLGALQINLVAKMIPQSNSDGTAGTAAATLLGYADYLNQTSKVSFVTDTASKAPNYDDTTGNYTARIVIMTAAGASQTLDLSATIHDGLMDGGTIQSASSSSNILSFSLVKDGPALADVANKVKSKAGSADPDANQVTSYIGTTTFVAGGETKPVHMLILRNRKGTAEDFLNLVIPGKLVDVSLNYGGAVQLIHKSASLDYDSNSLSGSTQLMISSTNSGATTQTPVTLHLDCTFADQNKSINCTHNSNAGSGTVATTKATLDTKNSQDPIDTSTGRSAVRKLYHAFLTQDSVDPKTGRVTRSRVSQTSAAGRASSAIDLLVTYPARTTADELVDLFIAPSEQTVTVTIVDFADDPVLAGKVNIGIRNVNWNERAGTLNGTDQITINGAGQSIMTIDCANFRSSQTSDSKEAFTCDYSSNQAGASLHFTGTGTAGTVQNAKLRTNK